MCRQRYIRRSGLLLEGVVSSLNDLQRCSNAVHVRALARRPCTRPPSVHFACLSKMKLAVVNWSTVDRCGSGACLDLAPTRGRSGPRVYRERQDGTGAQTEIKTEIKTEIQAIGHRQWSLGAAGRALHSGRRRHRAGPNPRGATHRLPRRAPSPRRAPCPAPRPPAATAAAIPPPLSRRRYPTGLPASVATISAPLSCRY